MFSSMFICTLEVMVLLNNMDLQGIGFGVLIMIPCPFPTNNGNKAFIDLILKPSDQDAKIWPHRYEFRLRITLRPGGI